MNDYKKYLDELRDSGKINMFSTVPLLEVEFGLEKTEARDILFDWMDSYK